MVSWALKASGYKQLPDIYTFNCGLMKSLAREQSKNLSKASLIILLSAHRSEAAPLHLPFDIQPAIREAPTQWNQPCCAAVGWAECRSRDAVDGFNSAELNAPVHTAALVGREHCVHHLLPAWKKGKANANQRRSFLMYIHINLMQGFQAGISHGQMCIDLFAKDLVLWSVWQNSCPRGPYCK